MFEPTWQEVVIMKLAMIDDYDDEDALAIAMLMVMYHNVEPMSRAQMPTLSCIHISRPI